MKTIIFRMPRKHLELNISNAAIKFADNNFLMPLMIKQIVKLYLVLKGIKIAILIIFILY